MYINIVYELDITTEKRFLAIGDLQCMSYEDDIYMYIIYSLACEDDIDRISCI